jgi:urocanate hydratase
MTGGDGGATGVIHKTIECVKIVCVYLNFQNNKIRVMVSNKYYDNFEYTVQRPYIR